MSSFASPFKFGLPGKEISLDGTLRPWTDSITIQFGREEAVNTNVQGEQYSRIHRRLQAGWSVNIKGATERQYYAIKGLYMAAHSFLSFIYAGPHRTVSQRYIMETASTFKLTSDSMLRLDKTLFGLVPPVATILTGFKVHKDYNAFGEQVTNNYFLSFNRADWTVTIDLTDASPPLQGEEVWASWDYTGSLVRIESFTSRHVDTFETAGGLPAWDIDLRLRGV